MKKTVKRLIALAAACTMMLACACAVSPQKSPQLSDSAVNLTDNLTANPVTGKKTDDAFYGSQLEFSVELFKRANAQKGENVLVSPASVMLALAMTANGADKETLSQMEDVLGLPIGELNKYLYQVYFADKKNDKALKVADSIWIKNTEDLVVGNDFLQTNKDYYNAEIYKALFDQSTVDDINNWCSAHTDGMIKKIMDNIQSEDVMHLINAVCFNAEWKEKYEDGKILDEKFTDENGKKTDIKLMYSKEKTYLKTDNASGFRKQYEGGYSFVAMLPDEGIKLSDFVGSLTADKVSEFLKSGVFAEVCAAIPEFSSDYDIKLNDALIDMGMPDAFDSAKADLLKLGKMKTGENLFIAFVNHFTHIEVDKNGTRAAAVTDVGVVLTAIGPNYDVILDRPFVYMIVDDATDLPVFIGTVTNIQ